MVGHCRNSFWGPIVGKICWFKISESQNVGVGAVHSNIEGATTGKNRLSNEVLNKNAIWHGCSTVVLLVGWLDWIVYLKIQLWPCAFDRGTIKRRPDCYNHHHHHILSRNLITIAAPWGLRALKWVAGPWSVWRFQSECVVPPWQPSLVAIRTHREVPVATRLSFPTNNFGTCHILMIASIFSQSVNICSKSVGHWSNSRPPPTNELLSYMLTFDMLKVPFSLVTTFITLQTKHCGQAKERES